MIQEELLSHKLITSDLRTGQLNLVEWSLLPARLVASRFVGRRPTVQGSSRSSDKLTAFLNQLGGINIFAPTRICRVMTRF